MPLNEDYSFRPVAGPMTLLGNVYGAMVNGLKSAATPGGPVIGQAGQPPEARATRRSQALGQYRFDQKYTPDGMPRHSPHFTEMLPTNPQETLSMLSQMAGGGAMMAARGLTREGAKALSRSGTTRTFLGPEAVDANLGSLQAAKGFLDEGVPPSEVWKLTGWGKGPDGNWMFEIPDTNLRVKPWVQEYLDKLQDFANRPKPAIGTPERDAWQVARSQLIQDRPAELAWKMNRDIGSSGLSGRLEDMVDHPQYFRNAPDAGKAELSIAFPDPEDLVRAQSASKTSPIAYGGYNPGDNRVSLARKLVNSDGSLDYQQTLAHEMQHLADNVAGRQAGGNVAGLSSDLSRVDASKSIHTAVANGHMPNLSPKDLTDASRVWEAVKDLEYWQLKADPKDVMRALFGKPRTSYEKYRAIPGELKGFSTQRRLDMSPEGRRMVPPWEQPSWKRYDVPEEFDVPVESFLTGR